MNNERSKDVQLAIQEHGWFWSARGDGRSILLPPPDDVRATWAAVWDESGIPHWLPKYSRGEV